jgi:hypothetical protein
LDAAPEGSCASGSSKNARHSRADTIGDHRA